MVTKVRAYIMRRSAAHNELLVFLHRDFPDVPLQIPGGTVDDGEALEVSLFREIAEESGLADVALLRKLGSQQYYWAEIDAMVEGHYYLLEAAVPTADTWQHAVVGDGADSGLVFSYEWITPTAATYLAGDLGDFLTPQHIPELYRR